MTDYGKYCTKLGENFRFWHIGKSVLGEWNANDKLKFMVVEPAAVGDYGRILTSPG